MDIKDQLKDIPIDQVAISGGTRMGYSEWARIVSYFPLGDTGHTGGEKDQAKARNQNRSAPAMSREPYEVG